MADYPSIIARKGAGTYNLTGTGSGATEVQRGTVVWGVTCDPGVSCEILDDTTSLDKVTAPALISQTVRFPRPINIEKTLKVVIAGGNASVYYGYL